MMTSHFKTHWHGYTAFNPAGRGKVSKIPRTRIRGAAKIVPNGLEPAAIKVGKTYRAKFIPDRQFTIIELNIFILPYALSLATCPLGQKLSPELPKCVGCGCQIVSV